ncbi:hypothetical protein [Mycetohabitans endofungorum]|uniref:hypothetical protein n=1 Tax=Mycetohabitans endofungorum TaxID=417203 RepID=UPI001E63B68B|nr:hypothetical protein [Mycetohabitans endofungorum]
MREILDEIKAFNESESSLPRTDLDARRKLYAQSLDDKDIVERVQAFKTYPEIDGAAVLASYDLLHGISYLEKAVDQAPQSIPYAAAIVAIYRGAEVCLHNLAVLSERMVQDLDCERYGQASVKAKWSACFQDTLVQLSQALVEMDDGSLDGEHLSLSVSEGLTAYRHSVGLLHHFMRTHGMESDSDIATKDIDDPKRYVYFSEYINRNTELIWLSIFNDARLPGVFRLPGQDDAAFYRQVVRDDDIRSAVDSVDLKSSTYLMQFRAYHQISEILTQVVNQLGCSCITLMLDNDEANGKNISAAIDICHRLLMVVNDNIKPILRTLSPKAYSDIRPALGITSGSHSANLRKGLFGTVYPLLVRAFRLRLSGLNEDIARDDDAMLKLAMALINSQRDGWQVRVMRGLIYLHHHVRLWRDEHIQFIKTQIGVAPEEEEPTSSISGSINAAASAHRFREVHQRDPIAPLYLAVRGRPFPAPLPLLTEGGFDEYMAHRTASAVKTMYVDVQQRAQKRRKKHRTH